MNFQKCCRLCTQEGDKVLVNLLENNEMRKSIEKLFSIEIRENQAITTLICVDCYREVIDIKKSLEVYESKKSAVLLHNTLLQAQASSVAEIIEVKCEEGKSRSKAPKPTSTTSLASEKAEKVTADQNSTKTPTIKINLGNCTVTPTSSKPQKNQRKSTNELISIPAEQVAKPSTPPSNAKLNTSIKNSSSPVANQVAVRRTERKRKVPVHLDFEDTESVIESPKKIKKTDSPPIMPDKIPMVMLENVSLKRISTGEVVSSGAILKQYSRKSDQKIDKTASNDKEDIPNVIKQTKITRTVVSSSTNSSPKIVKEELPINHVISIKNADLQSQNKSYKLVKSSDGNPNIKYKLMQVKSDSPGPSPAPSNSPQLTIRSVRSINNSASSTPGPIQKIVLARSKTGKGNFMQIIDEPKVAKTAKK